MATLKSDNPKKFDVNEVSLRREYTNRMRNFENRNEFSIHLSKFIQFVFAGNCKVHMYKLNNSVTAKLMSLTIKISKEDGTVLRKDDELVKFGEFWATLSPYNSYRFYHREIPEGHYLRRSLAEEKY